MIFKDYYKTLELSPAASSDEIKKAYRRMALRYHPDRTAGDKALEAKFKEVKEAYDVLSKAVKKEGYDLDWKKFHQAKNGRQETKTATAQKQSAPVTPVTFLNKIRGIKKLAWQGAKQQPAPELFQTLSLFLGDKNIRFLINAGSLAINNQIIEEVLEVMNLLPYAYIDSLSLRLAKLAGTDNAMIEKIYMYARKRQIKNRQSRAAIVLSIIALICLYIFLLWI